MSIQHRLTLDYCEKHLPELDLERIRLSIDFFDEMDKLRLGLVQIAELSGLQAGRFYILRVLFVTPGHALLPSDLAQILGVARASITKQLGILEGQGMVERQVNPDDRRSVYVHLTAAGHAFMATELPLYLQRVDRGLTGFETAHFSAVVKQLRQVLTGIEHELMSTSDPL
ncbi:MAG: MarR family winged helix-turn-helix transcriptional regulator [Plesiomonas sp.]|uniref:MarR family winged helix-turn-helix transcriptional regulator n=1 Tax=Plesiomonas sp. TaxID=2486279 RepID=UPI003F2DA6F1